MRTGKRVISSFCVVLAIALVSQPAVSQAQIFGGGLTNSVDLDLQAIIQCQLPEGTDELLEFIICNLLLPDLIDQLVESEAFLDQVFAGYRNDIPFFLRRQLDSPLRVEVVFDAIDGPGMILATAGPTSFANLIPNPFSRNFGSIRAWSIPRTARITLDVDDVVDLVLTELMVDVAVHEAFHAMGHPSAFLISGLNGPTNIFGQVNFLGDDTGIDESGFGLLEFRFESGNPFAQFIPLSQSDTAAHLSAFEPAFNQPANGIQEVFLATAAPPGIQAFMSRSLQGMFADLGYKVRGVNAAGFVDNDQDGIEDDPLIINPIPPGEPNP